MSKNSELSSSGEISNPSPWCPLCVLCVDISREGRGERRWRLKMADFRRSGVFCVKVKTAKGYLYVLHPDCELWTGVLPHRTQILYPVDIRWGMF